MAQITATSIGVAGGQASSLLPSVVPDGQFVSLRTTKYGEQMVQDMWLKDMVFGDEETLFYASTANSTPLAMGGATQTAFVTTTPSITIYNGGNQKIYICSIYILVTTAGTALTSYQWAAYVDTGNRYSSGGTGLNPYNTKMRDTSATMQKSMATVYAGAITASAASNQRMVGRGVLRTAIPVVLDQYMVSFGAVEQCMSAANTGGTNAIAQAYSSPGVIISPGCTFLFYTWGASMSATPQAELNIVYVER